MKLLAYCGIVVALAGCSNKVPEHEVKATTLPKQQAAKEELHWSALSDQKMNWRQAWKFCDSMKPEGNRWWRLPSAHEQYAFHGFSRYSVGVLPGPDRMWSGLFRENGVHYAMNVQNGAKTWFGDDDTAFVECVSGYSATVDPDAWIVEVYNARVMHETGRANAVIRRLAEAGLPDAQIEMGNVYADGLGVPRDVGEARKWYELARDRGHPYAAANLRQLDHPTPQPVAGRQPGPNSALEAASSPMPTPARETAVAAPAQAQVTPQPAPAAAYSPTPIGILVKVPVAASPGEVTQVGVMLTVRSAADEAKIDAAVPQIRRIALEVLGNATHGVRATLIDNQALAGRLLAELHRRAGADYIATLSLDDVDAGAD